jgi:hypothetical protein
MIPVACRDSNTGSSFSESDTVISIPREKIHKNSWQSFQLNPFNMYLYIYLT